MPEMPVQIARLLIKLIERTAEGEYSWSVGSREQEYVLALKSGGFVIESVDGDGQHPFRWTITNSSGVALEVWYSMRNRQYEPQADQIEKLYDGAKRSALGTTETINALLEELKDDDEIPF